MLRLEKKLFSPNIDINDLFAIIARKLFKYSCAYLLCIGRNGFDLYTKDSFICEYSVEERVKGLNETHCHQRPDQKKHETISNLVSYFHARPRFGFTFESRVVITN